MTDRTDNIRKELYDIVITPDILERIDLMEKWIDNKIKTLSAEQIIIDRKYLKVEHEDDLKYAMATKIAEKLLDECGVIVVEDNKVTVNITGVCR